MGFLQSNKNTLNQYHVYLKEQTACSGSSLKNNEARKNLIIGWAGEQPLTKAPSFEVSFPKYLIAQRNNKNRPYSAEYMKGCCSYARRFFKWARDHKKGYKQIPEEWIAKITPEKTIEGVNEIVFYSLEEVQLICKLEPESMRLRRAIAALAFLLLSGMSISAFLTLPIKDVNLDSYTVRQLPSDGVCTKYNKAAVTTLLINSKLMRIIREWDDMVRSQCPPDSTWYARLDNTGRLVPKTVVPMTVENKDELKKKALYPYSGFCKDLRKICKMAGVTYKSPHKARYGHIHLGFSKAKTAEERKAVSINAMHESLSITDDVYARMSSYQANKILLSFNFDEDDSAGSGQP